MKVVGVVLAAGLGTRLRPSTDHKPKPLIPVAGIEPLFFALDNFRRAGIERVIVNAHHLPSQIEQALKLWKTLLPTLKIRCVVERPEILGTGGGLINIIQKNRDWCDGSSLLIQNGDTLANIDLLPLLKRGDASCFAVSYLPEHLKKYNPLWVSVDGAWSGIGKVPPQTGDVPAHLLGVHLLSAKAVTELTGDEYQAVPNDLFNAIYRPLSNKGFRIEEVKYFKSASDDFWFDMTTQDFLLEAQRHVFHAKCYGGRWKDLLLLRYPGIREIKAGVWARGARWNADTKNIHTPAVLVDDMAGPGSKGDESVGPDATLIIERTAAAKLSFLPRTTSNGVVVLSADRGSAASQESGDNRVVII